MNILLDVEPFENPSAHLKLLDLFLQLKAEIMDSLLPLKEKIILSEGFLVIVLHRERMGIEYVNIDEKLRFEIIQLIGKVLDFPGFKSRLMPENKN